MNNNEGKNFESIVLADQVLKDRQYLITMCYVSKIGDSTFHTWRDLLYMEKGIFSDVLEEIDLLTRQVWNYGYFMQTSSAPVNRSTPTPGSLQSSAPLSYHKI
jgi:hypothetical protein